MSEEEIRQIILQVLETIRRSAIVSCRDNITVCDIECAIAELT